MCWVRRCRIDSPPPVWVQMSTAHIYGDPPSGLRRGLGVWLWARADSRQGVGAGFRRGQARRTRGAWCCGQALCWAEKAGPCPSSLMARVGLGGKIAKGTQGMSWIHEDDMDRLFMRAIEDESMRACTLRRARPVSNADSTLRRAVGMPVGLPAMGWMVRVGAADHADRSGRRSTADTAFPCVWKPMGSSLRTRISSRASVRSTDGLIASVITSANCVRDRVGLQRIAWSQVDRAAAGRVGAMLGAVGVGLVLVCEVFGSGWGEPELVGPGVVSTQSTEFNTTHSSDGRLLVLTRYDDASGVGTIEALAGRVRTG